jgi:hypothetical protein
MMSYLSNSRRKTRYPRARREVQVQGKDKKMSDIRKDPRMKNLSNPFSLLKGCLHF